ncbi:MAG: hypothetical protein ACLFRV_10335, partial [Acidimicrobiales bacterium]
MTTPRRRVAALASAIFSLVLFGAAIAVPAGANPGNGNSNGNSGAIFIKDDAGMEHPGNNPHVCRFTVVGRGLEADAEVTITIETQGNNGGEDQTPLTVTTDDEGDFSTVELDIPDGHYKATASIDDKKVNS